MIFPRDFLLILDHIDALVLSYLINTHELLTSESRTTDDDWFRCSTGKMNSNLRLSEHQHRTILTRLVRKKLIQRKMVGNPAKRYFWINYDVLKSLLDEAILRDTDDDS